MGARGHPRFIVSLAVIFYEGDGGSAELQRASERVRERVCVSGFSNSLGQDNAALLLEALPSVPRVPSSSPPLSRLSRTRDTSDWLRE